MKFIQIKKLIILGLLSLTFTAIQAAPNAGDHLEDFPTYFEYDKSELSKLCAMDSNYKMTDADLLKWDDIAAELDRKFPSQDTTRMYAYLYTAQKEAAYLSYNCHGNFVGNMGPTSVEVLKLFFSSVPNTESDEYSEQLAKTILAKLKVRITEENKKMKDFPINENDPKLKEFPKPYIGLTCASCTPWLLNDPRKFQVLTPPSQTDAYWRQQSEIVKARAESATPQQIELINYWGGNSGPKSGNWMAIANDYMLAEKVPFSKLLFVRSILAESGVDVDSALFYAKYTYLIKRPSMVNPSITTHIPFPKHPSYPSGHSTWSPFCATLLSHFFPMNKDEWFRLAEEAGQSRISAGIHYPLDHQNGWKFGIELGNAVLNSPKIIPNVVFENNYHESIN
jgi:membrane-associated phospholipid phosphatase